MVRDRAELKEETDARKKLLSPRKPYTLQARQTITQMQLSPDGKFVLGLINENPANSKLSPVPNWITDSSYPEELPGYARVGDDLIKRHLAVDRCRWYPVKSNPWTTVRPAILRSASWTAAVAVAEEAAVVP